jgi:hypothetical protein
VLKLVRGIVRQATVANAQEIHARLLKYLIDDRPGCQVDHFVSDFRL